MLKESPLLRTMLRATIVAAIAVLATLKASIGDGLDSQEWVDLISAGVVSFAAYLGIGAAAGPVEPYFGNTSRVEVPMPPAKPEPAE